ncbi:TetR/AcrR family transcriptional regulator [Catenuloplanes japonicus]|uniref:TetR/AcrR family transcriptional regulator n=1 Tax=Catenuloplanes japonicus TaxID=33876 RepID=UPI0005262EBB|nr:TetR/AcrR family transcriptional regulator [Catenuloplanes japonicus]
MTSFQRARSEEQREIRRQAILDTAAAMLGEMAVSEVALNELSRRTGLAKSAMLRYFESREAILLELLDREWQEWVREVAAAPDAEDTAALLVRTLAARPRLCDLFSANAGVLEHNVSAAVAGRYKHAAAVNVGALAELLRARLGVDGVPLAVKIIMVVGAVWAHSRPAPAMLAAYDTDPALSAMRLDFAPTLHDMISTLIAGTVRR